jgi:hypothetical protein
MTPRRGRLHRCRVFLLSADGLGFFVFALASGGRCLLRKLSGLHVFCAGIRELLSRFKRRPCAGRHLLFFAAAKKSRQKKAANTASSSVCLKAPKGSYASHGNQVTHVSCQRSCGAPHPLHAPASPHAVPDSPRPSRWQTVCRPLVLHTPHFGPIARASHLVRASRYTTRPPTHSLPPGRHRPFAVASPCTGSRSG